MQDENPSPFGWARRLAFVAVVLSGLATIVGSGGGGGAECSFFSNVCNPVVGPFSGPAIAYVYPQRISVQAGGKVTVSVDWSGIDAPSFQWRRSADAGQSYLDIAGATGTSLTLDNVQLSDDGVQFQVDGPAFGPARPTAA